MERLTLVSSIAFAHLQWQAAAVRSVSSLSAANAEGAEGVTKRSRCSSKTQEWLHSCTTCWDKSGRCAWMSPAALNSTDHALANRCVPNCNHPKNQDAELCEPYYCIWDEEKERCSFSDDNETFAQERELFCGNYKEKLEGEQKTFCKGWPTGGGHSDDTFLNPRTAILETSMRCWEPRPGARWHYGKQDGQAKMLVELNKTLSRALDLYNGSDELEIYPATMSEPLKMFGPAKKVMPYHWAVGFVSKKKFPSHCLVYNYSSTEEADKAGCAFFRKSFEPLQELTNCVQAKFEADSYWKFWEHVRDTGVFQKPADDFARGVEAKELEVTLRGKLGSDKFQDLRLTPELIGKVLKSFRACKAARKCEYLQTFYRVTEFLKRVDAQDWVEKLDEEQPITEETAVIGKNVSVNVKDIQKSGVITELGIKTYTVQWYDDSRSILPYGAATVVTQKVEVLRKLLKEALRDTISAPEDIEVPRLQHHTIESIMSCFNPESVARTEDVGKLGSQEALKSHKVNYLKESLACLPLMWDLVEVPPEPRHMLWPTTDNPPLEKHLKQTHPLCGRIGLAGLAIQFSRANYPPLHLLAFYSGAGWAPNSLYCMNPTYAQCKNFKVCWEIMMTEYLADLQPLCKVGEDAEPAPEVEDQNEQAFWNGDPLLDPFYR